MDNAIETHLFDQSLALEPNTQGWRSAESGPNEAAKHYWNAFGPFGGWIGALLLKSITADARIVALVAQPLTMQINFVAGLKAQPFVLRTRCVKQNRTIGFWTSEIVQTDAESQSEIIVAQAQFTFTQARQTFERADVTMPQLASADSVADSVTHPPRATGGNRPRFLEQYDYRPITGRVFSNAATMNSVMWVRDAAPRTLDALSLVALCDTPFPSVWLRLAKPVRITTVSMSVYFRVGPEELAQVGPRHVLLDTSCDLARHGYYDQKTNVWSPDGVLVAQTHQIAWYSGE